jgi:uncharacterized protein (DUF433 family)
MTLLGRIRLDPAICGGEPSIGKYSVRSLLDHLQAGRTHEELLAHYEDLWEEDLIAVEGYASAIQYQGSLTIRELVEQVRRCFAETGLPSLAGTENCEWFLDHIYEKLDATGPQNHHLAIPRGKHHWQRLDRHSPLTPDLQVNGQFLTLSWLNHIRTCSFCRNISIARNWQTRSVAVVAFAMTTSPAWL